MRPFQEGQRALLLRLPRQVAPHVGPQVALPDQPRVAQGSPAGDIPLIADADAPEGRGPTVVGFNKGDASFIVIKRADRVGLRVRDALALLTQFALRLAGRAPPAPARSSSARSS